MRIFGVIIQRNQYEIASQTRGRRITHHFQPYVLVYQIEMAILISQMQPSIADMITAKLGFSISEKYRMISYI